MWLYPSNNTQRPKKTLDLQPLWLYMQLIKWCNLKVYVWPCRPGDEKAGLLIPSFKLWNTPFESDFLLRLWMFSGTSFAKGDFCRSMAGSLEMSTNSPVINCKTSESNGQTYLLKISRTSTRRQVLNVEDILLDLGTVFLLSVQKIILVSCLVPKTPTISFARVPVEDGLVCGWDLPSRQCWLGTPHQCRREVPVAGAKQHCIWNRFFNCPVQKGVAKHDHEASDSE